MQQSSIAGKMDAIIEKIGGLVGIYALHIETGHYFSLNDSIPFPMASTDKIPLVAYCFFLAEQGVFKLNQQIPITPGDVRPGTGLLNKRFDIPGVVLTINNLIRLSLEMSDNTAFDLLLKKVGGPEAVTNWLKSEGILEMELSRSCLKSLAEQAGVENLPVNEDCTLEEFLKLEAAVDLDIKKHAEEKYLDDLQDSTTPGAMGQLIEKISTGSIINKASSDYLLDCLRRCQTGYNRIRGQLPSEAVVAHKTGTMYGITNDVGLITLPHNQGRLVVTIYIKSTSVDVIEKERGIAHIARVLYDAFSFSSRNE